MKRPLRIAFELLGPALIGTTLILIYFVGVEFVTRRPEGKSFWHAVSQVSKAALVILIFAYILTGIQSIIYTVIMEWRFRKGLDPGSWRSVRLSSFLGFCSGAALGSLAAGGDIRLRIVGSFLLWSGIGLAVGFIMGVLIKAWSAGVNAQEDISRE